MSLVPLPSAKDGAVAVGNMAAPESLALTGGRDASTEAFGSEGMSSTNAETAAGVPAETGHDVALW